MSKILSKNQKSVHLFKNFPRLGVYNGVKHVIEKASTINLSSHEPQGKLIC